MQKTPCDWNVIFLGAWATPTSVRGEPCRGGRSRGLGYAAGGEEQRRHGGTHGGVGARRRHASFLHGSSGDYPPIFFVFFAVSAVFVVFAVVSVSVVDGDKIVGASFKLFYNIILVDNVTIIRGPFPERQILAQKYRLTALFQILLFWKKLKIKNKDVMFRENNCPSQKNKSKRWFKRQILHKKKHPLS